MKETSEALENVNSSVIETLVQNHREFKSFLSRRVSNDEIAEDLLQQSLIRAIEKSESLESSESVVPWFYRILRNVLIDYYRSHASDSRKNDEFLKELISNDEDSQKPIDEVQAIVCACLGRLLPTLKPEYAQLVEWVDLKGMSIQDAAQKLKLTPNNLSVKLYRARQALKLSLERSCGTCTEHGCLDCSCE